MTTQHIYEVRPRKDRRGFDLISDASGTVLETHEQAGDFKEW
jgi:hypothetical protein